MPARRNDRLPRARVTDHPERRLAPVAVGVLLALGAGDDERVGLEHAESDEVIRGHLAVTALVDRLTKMLRRLVEALLLKLAVDEDRDPPAGDAVLAQFEEAGGHVFAPSPWCRLPAVAYR